MLKILRTCAKIPNLQRWIICSYTADIPNNDFDPQRWIICAYDQVHRHMDVFCVRTQTAIPSISYACAVPGNFVCGGGDSDNSFNFYLLSPRFFKKNDGDIAIASVRPSVRPSRYLLLNHWTKFNQIWCVCCSHEWGVQRHIFWPRPLGRGHKVKYY